MLNDDTLETCIKENKGKVGRIFDWLFDFYLTFIITISALICIPYAFNHPKIGMPVLLFSVIVVMMANL